MTIGEATVEYQRALEAERTCRNAVDDYGRDHRPSLDTLRVLEQATDAAWLNLAQLHDYGN